MDEFSPHVLIVAEKPGVRFALEELLRAYGYTVTSVSRAAAGTTPPPDVWAAVLVADLVPQTDRYGYAPADVAAHSDAPDDRTAARAARSGVPPRGADCAHPAYAERTAYGCRPPDHILLSSQA